MKKLSDFQPSNISRRSISETISLDTNENNLCELSESQNSLNAESMDDSTGTSNDKTDQITVKVDI